MGKTNRSGLGIGVGSSPQVVLCKVISTTK